MPWGCLPDVLETNKVFTGKESISLSNIFKSVSDKSLSNKPISDKSKKNPRKIQEALLTTECFPCPSDFEIQIVFLL